IVVVEAADRQEWLAAGDHVAAAREEERIAGLRLGAGADWISKAVLEGVTVKGHHTADEIDQLPAHVDDFSADRDDIGRRVVDRVDQRRKPARLRYGVVVQKDDIARRRARDARRDSTGEAMIFSLREESGLRIFSRDRADAAIARAVVDNDDRHAINIFDLSENR